MAEKRPQTFENHTRFDPVFHFFMAPLAIATFVAFVWNAIVHFSLFAVWLAISGLLVLMGIFLIRVYALKVQNRVIRLEERLRLTTLLPDPQRARIAELTESQLIALRFASDAELPALAARSLQEGLAAKDIKKSIRSWRPDYYRV